MTFRRVLQVSLAVLFGSVLLSVASPAGAVDNPDYTAPPPTTVVTTPPTTTEAVSRREVVTAVAVTPVRSQMAITGADVAQLAALGTGLLAVGAVVLVARRRTAAA